MSKPSATLESPATSGSPQAKRTRKSRTRNVEASGTELVRTASAGSSSTKPLLLGVGIGAALALTAVALGSRPSKSSYFSVRPPTIAGALTKTAAVLLARMVARKAFAAAANQGARKLASAWPL